MNLQNLLEAIEKTITISSYEALTGRQASASMVDKYIAILNYYSHNPIVLGSNYDTTKQARGHIKRVIHKNRPMFDLNEVTYLRLIDDKVKETIDENEEIIPEAMTPSQNEKFIEVLTVSLENDAESLSPLEFTLKIFPKYEKEYYSLKNTKYSEVFANLEEIRKAEQKIQNLLNESLNMLEDL